MRSSAVPLTTQLQKLISSNKVFVISGTYCPYCSRAKAVLKEQGLEPVVVEVDKDTEGPGLREAVIQQYNHRTVPAVFVNGKFVGGCDDTVAAINSGKLKQLLSE
eukprot:NODE_12284_length_404_cov_13.341637_g11626_i0.p1 GENE.NODE_12284_length_404_cov_13.341637_g11626_i0~~NODE_12284_length_404_cov_13.341637_g11626_i0.p1  ORF type:complete len:118 (-),score=25.28 NODE_12284_length_404_cov_13.341637_g11626_i0:51-365(-)